jgi:hypothetical protein
MGDGVHIGANLRCSRRSYSHDMAASSKFRPRTYTPFLQNSLSLPSKCSHSRNSFAYSPRACLWWLLISHGFFWLWPQWLILTGVYRQVVGRRSEISHSCSPTAILWYVVQTFGSVCLETALADSHVFETHLTILDATCPDWWRLATARFDVGVEMKIWQQRYILPPELWFAVSQAGGAREL